MTKYEQHHTGNTGTYVENEIEIEREACESARESFNIFDFMLTFCDFGISCELYAKLQMHVIV